jgi:hypothetical protein
MVSTVAIAEVLTYGKMKISCPIVKLALSRRLPLTRKLAENMSNPAQIGLILRLLRASFGGLVRKSLLSKGLR